jgi:flagellar biogenesis protein FliO
VAKNAVQALIVGLKFLVNAGIWLVVFFLPLAIALALPIAFVVWLVRRLRRRNKGSRPVPPPAEPA